MAQRHMYKIVVTCEDENKDKNLVVCPSRRHRIGEQTEVDVEEDLVTLGCLESQKSGVSSSPSSRKSKKS